MNVRYRIRAGLLQVEEEHCVRFKSYEVRTFKALELPTEPKSLEYIALISRPKLQKPFRHKPTEVKKTSKLAKERVNILIKLY